MAGSTGSRAKVAPVIAIPTTAGTGAEVGRAALLTLDDGRKLGIISPHLIPKRAICDPELTLGLPPMLTAATGLDALSHCIETLLLAARSIRRPRRSRSMARGASGATSRWRRRDGSDLDARSEMMMGALMGGLSFQKGLGAVHSLSHALGGLKDVSLHHGTLNAILMPIVVRFNAPAIGDKLSGCRRRWGSRGDARRGARRAQPAARHSRRAARARRARGSLRLGDRAGAGRPLARHQSARAERRRTIARC